MSQSRDVVGRFGTSPRSTPGVTLSALDIEGFRGTLTDFLEGSLPSFGFVVPSVDDAVDRMVDAFLDAHIDA